eukprot:m.20798 g.20798  ORF g.20798 m.20798 type:complete len:415 (-) comp3564_c0_seq1:48-1292(-)
MSKKPEVVRAEEEDDDISDVDLDDDYEEDDMHDPGLTDPEVVTKYKVAADAANRVVKKVADACVAGATTISLCKLGDSLIAEETANVYSKKVNGKAVHKGVGFPTCISINNVVCHSCPLESEATTALKAGDVVKIDLGVQIAGYVAAVASTVIVGATKEAPATGPVADAIMACNYAIEAAIRLLRPGNNTADISKAIQKIAEDFHCKPVEGMLSHLVARHVIDGEKAIILNPSEQQKKDHKDSVIEVNEAYALDIIISSGEGKPRIGDARASVYKKTDNAYQLKMRNSRAFLGEVNRKFGYMPFTLRAVESEAKARMALTECVRHGVIQPYEVLLEREGAVVVQCKMQVLLLASGSLRITMGSLPTSVVKSEYKVSDPELNKLLLTSISGKSKKKSGAKKDGAAAAADDKAPAS